MIFRKNRIKLLKIKGANWAVGLLYPTVGIGISIKEWTSVLLLTDIIVENGGVRNGLRNVKGSEISCVYYP